MHAALNKTLVKVHIYNHRGEMEECDNGNSANIISYIYDSV